MPATLFELAKEGKLILSRINHSEAKTFSPLTAAGLTSNAHCQASRDDPQDPNEARRFTQVTVVVVGVGLLKTAGALSGLVL